jgi:septum formation protein
MSLKLSKTLILGSQSPRRKEILQLLGFEFSIRVLDIDESFDTTMMAHAVPKYLAFKKNNAIPIQKNEILLTADTVVIVNNKVLNKPENESEAKEMLQMLSGNKHTVVSACCLRHEDRIIEFSDECIVEFQTLDEIEINYYIKKYKPFDKAGSYGVQDFIGLMGINSLEGSFYTVMGLPAHMVYSHLKPFLLELTLNS